MNDKTIMDVSIGTAIIIGCICLYLTWQLGRRRLTLLPALLTLIAFIIASVLFWYTHRPLPPNLDQTLFNGITYNRKVLDVDGTVIVYTVKVDLDAAGIRFMVTPRQQTAGYLLPARTTSQFLDEFGLQLAINADFFDPWRDYGLTDYYPHVGDGVNVHGLSISQGDRYTEGYSPPENYETLYLTKDNRASFQPPTTPIYNAISGNMMLLIDGQITPIEGNNDYLSGKHPRTAVALDASSRTLIIVLVDGRQPNYSEGVTIPELQAIVLANDGYNALNLDGGGSVTLAIEGENGLPMVLNSPIHNHIPGRERPIANHFGIFAQPLGG